MYYFITDYLPAAIYDRDRVTGCFRVQNVSSVTASLEFVSTAFDANGKVVAAHTDKLTVKKAEFGSCQATHETVGCAALKFELRKEQQTISAISVRLLRDDEPWPETAVRNGRIEIAKTAEVLIPAVTRRLKVQDRAFAPIKWMLAADKKDEANKPGNCIVFAPAAWGLRSQVKAAEIVELGPYSPDAAPPMLRVLEQIATRAKTLKPGGTSADAKHGLSIIVCLPKEDLEAATEPRVFRILVDAMLARLASSGAKTVTVVPPFHYGAKEQASQVLWREVDQSAAAYGAKSVDPSEYLQEEFWRVDPEHAGVYAPKPNSRGLKKIAQGLFLLQ